MFFWKVVFLAIIAGVSAFPSEISSKSQEKCTFTELKDEKMIVKYIYSCAQVNITLERQSTKTHGTIKIEPHNTNVGNDSYESDEKTILRISELPKGIKTFEKVDFYSVFISDVEFESHEEILVNIFEQLGIDSNLITALDVSNCAGFGLKHLINLKELWSLSVSDSFEGLDNEIGAVLPQLRVLYLYEVGIETLPNLVNLNYLEDFMVECNLCREIPQKYFKSNTFLTKISITGPEITEVHHDFCKNLVNLKELSLQIKGTKLPALTECKALTSVQIWNEEKGEKVPEMSGLSDLRDLMLMKTALKTIPSEIFTTNPHLKFVHLFDNDIKDVPADSFARLLDLQFLDLSDNQIQTFSDASISSEKLEYLSLGRNLLSNYVPSKEIPRLTYLDLAENQLQGKLSLKNFIEIYQQLAYLTLNDNLYTEVELKGPFFAKEDTIEVNLSDNQIKTITIDAKTVGTKSFEDETSVNIDLSGNPLICDCLLRPFLEALRRKNSNVYLMYDVKCADKPGKSLKTIDLEEIPC